eukprot:scaffold69780_cov47-Phaeocystis_antarctica.AAC.2
MRRGPAPHAASAAARRCAWSSRTRTRRLQNVRVRRVEVGVSCGAITGEGEVRCGPAERRAAATLRKHRDSRSDGGCSSSAARSTRAADSCTAKSAG